MRVFLLQDRLKALGGKSAADIKHVHVVGAGVMGGDIAAWSALRGFTVTLQDQSLKFIEPALQRAQELFKKRLRDPAKAAAASERLRADVDGAGVPDADVVIEAIFEQLEAKQELYARLEPRMKPDRAAGNQHLEPHAGAPGRTPRPARAARGIALLQSRAADAAHRDRAGHEHRPPKLRRWRPPSRGDSTSSLCRAAARRGLLSTGC